MPDAFESGTLNLPGIIGLNEGLAYIESQGMENIHNHELALTQAFLEGLQSIDVVNIVGKQDIQDRTAVVSITIDSMDHVPAIAKQAEAWGVDLMNCIAMIPVHDTAFEIIGARLQKKSITCVNLLVTMCRK